MTGDLEEIPQRVSQVLETVGESNDVEGASELRRPVLRLDIEHDRVVEHMPGRVHHHRIVVDPDDPQPALAEPCEPTSIATANVQKGARAGG